MEGERTKSRRFATCREAGCDIGHIRIERGQSLRDIDCWLENHVVFGFERFYSGLGREELENYGAGLDLRLEF